MIAYILAGAIALSGLLGFGLYKQVQANGIYKANQEQLLQTVDEQHQRFVQQIAERKRIEQLLVETEQQKQLIANRKARTIETIKEVKVNAPPEDCINQPVPDDIVCLFDKSCDKGNADRTAISTKDTAD